MVSINDGALPEAVQTTLSPTDPVSKIHPKNTLNDLSGTDWLKFLKSWFVFDAPRSDLNEVKRICGSWDYHPASFSPSMIEGFVRFFTKSGMTVFDPFAGIGSTLVACERTGRCGIGIELNPEYAGVARKRVSQNQTVINGDSAKISEMGLPSIDFCINSPPYWNMLHKIDVTQQRRKDAGLDTKYSDNMEDLGNVGDYGEFLEKVAGIYFQVYDLLNPGKYMVVIVQNVVMQNRMVPLAWDLAIRLSQKFIMKQEKVWCQDQQNLHPFGYPTSWVSNTHHHYCLVFQKPR